MRTAKPWILLSARREQKEGLRRNGREAKAIYCILVNMSKLTRERERERD